MSDKTTMLRSLAIERTGPAAKPAPRRWPLLAGAAVLIVGSVAATWWFVAPDAPANVKAVAHEVAVPRDTPPAPASTPAAAPEPRRAGSLIASGYVVARRKATVAAEVTGKVVELLVDEGMVVTEGQVLARLDSVLVEKDLALAKSRAEAADAAAAAIAADLRDAERIYNRTSSLSQKNFASEAEARVAVLRAQLRQAQAQLETARLDALRNAAVLEKHSIRAPFPGVVVERSAQPGEMISPMSAGGFTRTGICTLVDMDSIEIEVDVNEAFIGRIHQGTGVDAVLDAYPDWVIPGVAVAIVPTANREKATVKVRIGLKQKDVRILPDMAVKVTFIEEMKPTAQSATPSEAN
jgi:HlyD family secretion protein